MRCNDFLLAIFFNIKSEKRRDYMTRRHQFRKASERTEPRLEIAACNETAKWEASEQGSRKQELRSLVGVLKRTCGSSSKLQRACDFERRLRVFSTKDARAFPLLPQRLDSQPEYPCG